MHLNSNAHQRPNLLAGNPASTPIKHGRILADMDGQGASQPRTPIFKRTVVLWWAVGTLTLAVMAFSIIPRFLSPAFDRPVSSAPATRPAAARIAPVIQPVQADAAALIIDAAATPQPATTPSGADTQAHVLDQIALTATPVPARPLSKTKAQPDKPARKSASTTLEQENLLGTLLGLIDGKKTPEDGVKPAVSTPQTMDELVAKLDAEQRQRAEDQRKALEAVADKPKQMKR